jgi:uncharacterized membrane protein
VFDTINGLPVHPLVVHGVVVLVPLAVLLLLASLASKAIRRRAGIATPLFATATLALIPVAAQSGESLKERVGEGPLVETHAELGESLLPWMIGVAVVSWAVWLVSRRTHETADRAASLGRWLIPLAIVGLVVSVGAGVAVVRIGDSGAKAVWSQTGQTTPDGGSGGGDD